MCPLGKKDHPVHHAAAAIDRTVELLREQRMMPHPDPRTAARHQMIDDAAPDIQAWKGRLPLSMIHKLAKTDRGE